MLDLPIYLDNHATTRTDPRVLAAMWPYFSEQYGNASSTHHFGRAAAEAVEISREQAAGLIGARPKEIVFTSGATESNNLAIKGSAPALASRGRHIVSATSEHKSVLDPLKHLSEAGWEVTLVPCDENGMVSVEAIRASLTDKTVLVSIMAANNEVGTINPFASIGELCHERGVLFHTDATQAAGKLAIDVERDGIDLLSFSAHKLYGPKGIGCLYVRNRNPHVKLQALFDGGGHERGNRSGTLAVPLVVGLGEAIQIALEEQQIENARILALRDCLYQGMIERLEGVKLNGHPTQRLPANLNLSFAGIDSEVLMMTIQDLAISSGSACTSAHPSPSHVLMAMGLDEMSARASLRFGLGRFTTSDEVEFAIDSVTAAVTRLRSHTGTR